MKSVWTSPPTEELDAPNKRLEILTLSCFEGIIIKRHSNLIDTPFHKGRSFCNTPKQDMLHRYVV